jgi:hypothetical protein
MKKIFLLALACIMMLGAQAQIVSSRSVTIKKSERTTTNYVRFGVGFMNVHGCSDLDETSTNVGYNVVWGIQKPITDFNLYYDFNLGLGSRGFKDKEYDYDASFIAHNVQLSPVNIGWKPSITDNIRFDAHVGAYVGYDYTGKYKDDEGSISLSDMIDELEESGGDKYKRFDAGLNVGVGVWYDRFNIDLSYQAGFVNTGHCMKTRNLLLRLGFAF